MIHVAYKKCVQRYKKLEVFDQGEYRRHFIFSVVLIVWFLALLSIATVRQIPTLIVANLISILLFLYATKLITKIKFKSATLVFTFTNLVSIALHTATFGTDAGFHMLLWPLACLFAINICIRASTGRNVAFLVIFSFASLQYFIPAKTAQPFFEYSMFAFLFVSGAIIALAMTSMSTGVSRRRKKLERLANRDNLTDLYNRRFFTNFLNYQLAVALREKRSFTLAMADIDHFKSINDNHGHDVGDKVLVAVASCFKAYLAQHDAACRWGGEEFLIYLPESKVEHAERVVQAVASVVSDEKIEDVSVTMSFGLVESDGNESLDEILQRVDALMYQAKSQGRDNIQTALL